MLILLIGPKGSGKSHIGHILESSFGIHFFHVEPVWMSYYAECKASGKKPTISEGIQIIHPFIANALRQHKHVCVETTGASLEILNDLKSIGRESGIFIIRIQAPLDICLQRISTRDQTNQIPLDTESIRKIHQISTALEIPCDLVVENTALTKEEIVKVFTEALVE